MTETDLPEIILAETPFYEIAISWRVPDFCNTIGTKRKCHRCLATSAFGGLTDIRCLLSCDRRSVRGEIFARGECPIYDRGPEAGLAAQGNHGRAKAGRAPSLVASAWRRHRQDDHPTKSVQQNDRRIGVTTTATAEVKACHAGKPGSGSIKDRICSAARTTPPRLEGEVAAPRIRTLK